MSFSEAELDAQTLIFQKETTLAGLNYLQYHSALSLLLDSLLFILSLCVCLIDLYPTFPSLPSSQGETQGGLYKKCIVPKKKNP